MSDILVRLTVRKSVKDSLMQDCKALYLKSHPEMEHIKLTENKVLFEICEYYLK